MIIFQAFYENNEKISKFCLKFCQNNWFNLSRNSLLALNGKLMRLEFTIFHLSAEIDQTLCKKYEKCEQNSGSEPNVHKILNLRNSSDKKKQNLKSFFLILRLANFIMIPLTNLYDEYIDRRKLT